ncbi:MAG: cytochrome c1 [Betaproteobacteria bacterium]|nr:cytochrome c1 [Betaproteobacteria bacterium]MDE2123238.1 cytochrome c1 [Betaproteobacteria bacterium]MDE2186690.1 cytochrome c1 [Betaproteobacteria bacterium]MDE2325951.1 cytochrome c1 [Betaproteobacteria bacterium]
MTHPFRWLLRLALALGLSCGAAAAQAASEQASIPLEHVPYRVNDLLALQNGAKLFVNYCLNCHSAKYMRYERLRSIGLTADQVQEYLMFSEPRLGDTMKVAMTPAQAAAWFGASPPDLSVIERALASHRGSGADFLYTYLLSFYRDTTRPNGWNNLVLPGVAMPNPLWPLQGERAAKFAFTNDPASPGLQLKRFVDYEQLTPGSLSPTQYDSQVADLVAYMQWMAEPDQLERKRLGVIVLLFLALFTFITWRLKSDYWKDVT